MTASGSTPGTLTLTASSNGLATGEHTGQVTLTSSINNLTIDVRAVVADKLYASYVPGVRR